MSELAAAVVVVGGGPAGSAAAATLRRAGVDVVLVHRPGQGAPVGEGAPPGTDRVIAATFGSGGGAVAFEPARHLRSYANRAAWGGPELLAADFTFDPFGPGWHLDRAAFDADLRAAAARLGAGVVEGALASWEGSPGAWRLQVAGAGGPVVVRAGLVCDASGRSAVAARARGARRSGADRLVAAVAVVATDPGARRDPTTTVEAVEDGWWYTAPVPGWRRVVAFLTDGDLLEAGEARTVEGLARRLAATEHVAAVVAAEAGRWVSAPSLHAAGTSWLDQCAGPGWVAAGDAAATFDPLSSQGILSALHTGRSAGRALVGELVGTVGGDRDPGAEEHHAEVARLVAEHRRALAATYALEGRWPASPFWSRRRGEQPLA